MLPPRSLRCRAARSSRFVGDPLRGADVGPFTGTWRNLLRNEIINAKDAFTVKEETDHMVTNAIARRLDAIQQKSAMRSVDVANLLGTRPETVSRWNQGGKAFPRPDAQKLLLDLELIVDQLSDFSEPAGSPAVAVLAPEAARR